MNNLSNEQLKQIIENDHVQCGDAYSMARELLAYREAQGKPYGYVHKRLYETSGSSGLSNDHEAYGNVESSSHIPLYTAPQLPDAHDEPTDDERILAIEGIIQPLDEFDSSSRQFESLRRGESD